MDENIDLSKNVELNEALKEFEAKNVEQTQQAPMVSGNSETPKMVQWVMKLSGGKIKDEKQANYVLLGFVILAVIVSLFFIFSGSGNTQKEPSQKSLEQMKQMQLEIGQ